MKTLIPLLLVFWVNIFAQEIFLIEGLEDHPQREGVVLLKSPDHPFIQVDCSSFLFGITVKDHQRSDFLYLYENECYDIIDTLMNYSHYQQKACLGVDFNGKDWQLWKTDGDCP